jgi:sorting nexin-9/18/33
MATLPRSAKSSTPNSSAFHRPHSALDFDAGINASTAWTEHLERSISDEEPDEEPDDDTQYRTARALYAFEGKAEFRELSIEAGVTLYVVKEKLADGWSLVKTVDGEMGLLPRSYYTFTLDFQESSQVTESGFQPRTREASSSTITPRGSPTSGKVTLPITPQTTGDWRSFPSFTQSLLGGKSLNRFSSFVTSGAEAWVLNGTAVDEPVSSTQHHRRETTIEDDASLADRMSALGTAETDRHFVEAGPSWKAKLPPFQVLVHSPLKRTSTLTGAFTIYSVTSLFRTPAEDGITESPTRITVYRRFSHFVLLHTALCKRLPGIALPPLPEKQYTGRFSDAFVEARRGDLERYIARVVRHPVARYAEVLTFFLSCENDLVRSFPRATESERQLIT